MSDRDQQGKETRRAFLVEAREQPLGVDVSDFGDEFVEGFLNGQENALEFIELVLDGTMATFDQARFVKPWLEALPGAPVEPPVLSRAARDKLLAAPVPAPRLEWREGKAASVGPMTDQITKWHTTTEVTDGKLYWSITWAAEERFVLRVKDDNRTDTVWLGHRSSLDAAKSLAEKLQGVLDERA